jgi:RNA recognition motif-containing protein
MAHWLFVNALPMHATTEEVTALFVAFGPVQRALLFKSSTEPGQIAFVEMATDEAAKRAAQALDGSEFLGRQIRVVLIERSASKS